MTKKIQLAVIAAFAFSVAGLCFAQSDAPYTEGPVWAITMVQTKAGMSDDYLKALAKIYKSTSDEAKKQGIIMDYKILVGDASSPHDFDILLMQEFQNMAAFDGLRDKLDPIDKKIVGSLDVQRQGAVKRMEIREILGNKLMREVTLK
ncbi:MAG TPA: hypothetical protein VIL63_01915 [Terriglobales bacterium]|jgi:hypothetical protein